MKLKVLIVPPNNANCNRRFLHITDSSLSIQEIAQQIVDRYFRLYPGDEILEINRVQDEHCLDLDPEYLAKDVFNEGNTNVIRVIINNELQSIDPKASSDTTKRVSDATEPISDKILKTGSIWNGRVYNSTISDIGTSTPGHTSLWKLTDILTPSIRGNSIFKTSSETGKESKKLEKTEVQEKEQTTHEEESESGSSGSSSSSSESSDSDSDDSSSDKEASKSSNSDSQITANLKNGENTVETSTAASEKTSQSSQKTPLKAPLKAPLKDPLKLNKKPSSDVNGKAAKHADSAGTTTEGSQGPRNPERYHADFLVYEKNNWPISVETLNKDTLLKLTRKKDALKCVDKFENTLKLHESVPVVSLISCENCIAKKRAKKCSRNYPQCFQCYNGYGQVCKYDAAKLTELFKPSKDQEKPSNQTPKKPVKAPAKKSQQSEAPKSTPTKQMTPKKSLGKFPSDPGNHLKGPTTPSSSVDSPKSISRSNSKEYPKAHIVKFFEDGTISSSLRNKNASKDLFMESVDFGAATRGTRQAAQKATSLIRRISGSKASSQGSVQLADGSTKLLTQSDDEMLDSLPANVKPINGTLDRANGKKDGSAKSGVAQSLAKQPSFELPNISVSSTALNSQSNEAAIESSDETDISDSDSENSDSSDSEDNSDIENTDNVTKEISDEESFKDAVSDLKEADNKLSSSDNSDSLNSSDDELEEEVPLSQLVAHSQTVKSDTPVVKPPKPVSLSQGTKRPFRSLEDLAKGGVPEVKDVKNSKQKTLTALSSSSEDEIDESSSSDSDSESESETSKGSLKFVNAKLSREILGKKKKKNPSKNAWSALFS